jgi:hypothetical protein
MHATHSALRWIVGIIFCWGSVSLAQTQFHSWTALYDGTAGLVDRSVAVVVDGTGDVFVAGVSRNASGNDDLVVAKLAESGGTLLWERRYDGPAAGADRAVAIALDAAGHAVVAGSSVNAAGDADIVAIKVDGAAGTILWETRLAGAGDGDDAASGLAIDPSGNVVVCGSVRSATGNDDFYVAKLNGATGDPGWLVQVNGQGSAPHDRASAVTCDAVGNVFVTGYRCNGSGNDDFLTLKIAGDSGGILWEAPFDGVANGRDRAVGLALVPGGDVAVSGSSRGAGGNDDYHTMKLSGVDGSILWTAGYNGPANDSDAPTAIAVDDAGAVIVTGLSWNTSNQDIYTAKYSPEGVPVWGHRYNGPANRADAGLALAVDGGGNAVVTGYSWGTSADVVTLLLGASSGSVLWSRRFLGSGADDSAAAVFVDEENSIITTGETWSGGDSDFFTAKYVRVVPPGPELVALGAPADFSVSAASGSPLTYSWRKAGVAIPATNANLFSIGATTLGSAGAYSVLLRNALDSVATPPANLAVVSLESRSLLINEGSAAILKLSYAGQDLSFQWLKGGQPVVDGGRISGARTPVLRIASTGASDVATYSCRVTLAGQTLTSGEFSLDLRFRPTVAATPADTLLLGLGASGSLQVTAGGSEPLSYQWFRDGVAVPGATEPILEFEEARLAQAGSYSVRIRNAAGTVFTPPSRVAVVDVASKDILANEGSTAAFALSAAGTGLSYAWFRVATRLNNEGNVTGADTRVLRLSQVSPADIDSYYCEVTLGTRRIQSGDYFLNIRRKPVMSPYTPGTWIVGGGISDNLSASNNPVSFSVQGLPRGVTCNSLTGVISGKPQVAGSYPLVITARNLAGTSVAIGTTVTVLPLPQQTSGLFSGLVERDEALNAMVGGSFSISVASSASFSGSLRLNGSRAYRFRGVLDASLANDPSGVVPIGSGLELDFSIDRDTGELSGTLGDGLAETAVVEAQRSPWSASSHPATAYAGAYTNAMEPRAPWVNDLAYPQGNGYGWLAVNAGGGASVSAVLADGTKVTQAARLTSTGRLAFHLAAYRGTGSVQGWAQITPGTPSAYVDSTITGLVDWFKAGPSSGRGYASGFAPHGLDVIGGKYLAPGIGDLILGLPSQADNAQIAFSGARIEQSSFAPQLNRTFRISDVNHALFDTSFSNPARLTLLITPSTGALRGTFRLQDVSPLQPAQTVIRDVTFRGVLIPVLGIGVGHFQLPQLPEAGPPATTASTSPVFSGQMILEAAP